MFNLIKESSSKEINFFSSSLFRLYNEKYHPLYDFDDGVTIVKDNESLKRYLNKKDVVKNTSRKEIIKKFFYKYDKKAHLRLKKILKNL